KIGFSTVYAQVRRTLRRRAALHCGGVGNLADSVERAVARGLPHGTVVLVACSGGADSVALAASAVRVGVRCAIGHVDHGLRAGSAVEADGVRDLARHLGAEFYLKKIDKLNIRGPGLEAAARSARYEALAELAQAAGATVVATAHTRRDQAETLLLRLFRGAGPEALAGAAALFAEEDELLDALAKRAARLHPVLQRRALLAAANEQGIRPEREHLDAILRLLERGEGAADLPGGRAVVKFEGRREP